MRKPLKKKRVPDSVPKRQPKARFKQHPKAKAVAKAKVAVKPAAKKSTPAKPEKLDLKTAAGRAARDAAIVKLFVAGMVPKEIAGKMQCEMRIVNAATEATRDVMRETDLELARANFYGEGIVKDWRLGRSAEQIAKIFKVNARVVRAAVYLAQQSGTLGGGIRLRRKEAGVEH